MYDYFCFGFLFFFEMFGNFVIVREIVIFYFVCKVCMCVFCCYELLIFVVNDFFLIINIVKNCKFLKNCD